METLRPRESSQKLPTIEVRWIGCAQALGLRASDTPGFVELQYHSGSGMQTAEMEDRELYVWLMASLEYPQARLGDIDGDGFCESWFYAPNLCLYDFYGGRLHQPVPPDDSAIFVEDTLEAVMFSPENRNRLFMGEDVGECHLYAYRDGGFQDLGGSWDAMFRDRDDWPMGEDSETTRAILERMREDEPFRRYIQRRYNVDDETKTDEIILGLLSEPPASAVSPAEP